MGTVPSRLKTFLDACAAGYEIVHHRRRFTAQHTAEDVHTSGKRFAKTVFLWVDGRPAMAVLPADRHVDLSRLRKLTGATTAELATENEMKGLCPDCETGAEPPFGNLYDLPVYLAPELALYDEITFNAGTHEDAIRMNYDTYTRLVKPLMVDLAADH